MNRKDKGKLTFGIMLGPFPPWKKIVGWAKLVEDLGFDKLWLPDHFVNPGDTEMDWVDCWSVLTALATQTEKITMGTLVSSITFCAIRQSWRTWRSVWTIFREAVLNLEWAQPSQKMS